MENDLKYFLILFSLLSAQIAIAEAAPPPVTTVTSGDLNQYLGTWYEIAAIPQFIERKCVGNTTAQYNLAENDLMSVLNTCDGSNGKSTAVHGRAEVVDHYSDAVVGSPNRKYAWVLSRTPKMPAELLAEARLALSNQDFDTYKLISTPQT